MHETLETIGLDFEAKQGTVSKFFDTNILSTEIIYWRIYKIVFCGNLLFFRDLHKNIDWETKNHQKSHYSE